MVFSFLMVGAFIGFILLGYFFRGPIKKTPTDLITYTYDPSIITPSSSLEDDDSTFIYDNERVDISMRLKFESNSNEIYLGPKVNPNFIYEASGEGINTVNISWNMSHSDFSRSLYSIDKLEIYLLETETSKTSYKFEPLTFVRVETGFTTSISLNENKPVIIEKINIEFEISK